MSDIFTGVIIEESLENKEVLQKVKRLSTKISPVTERHQTPRVKQWTLDTVEVLSENAENIAHELSLSLDSEHPWYADFKNATHHYAIGTSG